MDEDIVIFEDSYGAIIYYGRAEHEARLRQVRRLADMERENRKNVNSRAQELLLSFLTEQQQYYYTFKSRFTVIGSCGTPFHIHVTVNDGNIDVLSPSHPEIKFGTICGGPRGLPMDDRLLGQMLALQTNEEHFVSRVCNAYGDPPVKYRKGKIVDPYKDATNGICVRFYD